MRWFLNLSTRGKLYLSFGLMVVLLAVVAAAAYRSVTLIQESQKALYAQEFTDVVDIHGVRDNQIANRADMLSMMVPGSRVEVAAVEAAIRGRVKRTDEGMRRLLERNQADPENLKRLQEFESLRRSSLQTRESETLPLIRAGKLEEARQLHLGIQAQRDAQMDAIADAFLARTEQAVRSALERSEQAARNSGRIFLMAGSIALLLAVAMTLLLNRVMAEPLKELAAAAERVAAGDLGVEVPAGGRADETGTLLQTFALMLASLRMMTRDLSTEKRLLQNLMDSIPDAIFFKDREGRFLRINKVHAANLGVQRPEDAVGRPTSDFFPPDESRQRNAEDDEILRTGKALPDKVRRISLAGHGVRWSSTTKAPIKDESGQVTGLVGIARDVTERQRLQEELRAREAGLRRAQLMAKLAHVITRPDGSFESWSETLPQLIGVDSAATPKSTREWLNIVHPDDKQKFREKAIETSATGERFDLEYRLRRADGAWIEIRQVSEPMRGEADASGQVRWFGTLQDVTEQKQAEEKLRASESLKGAILESSLDCIVTMDHEGKIVEFNPAAESTFGYTRAQAIGRAMAELIIPPGLRDAHHRGLAHYLATGKGPVLGKRLELSAVRADGTEFPIELAITSIRSGSTPLFTGFIRDITERKEAQERINRLNRVNEMLSSINGAIVRIRDRLELYEEACRIAVETGGLRFAWLCVVDEDEMRLKPVASTGADEGYLDLIRGRLSLRDDAPEGHGIAAKAAREKRALVVNDAQSDPNVRFKQEHAARGIRSMAMLPLSVEGKVVGTFGLHSGEVGFFDDQEMKLIDEIAGNIAFALDHIDKEEKVERLNRVYAVLSGINTLIVRVRDSDELFREACRIAVEAGKLRFVWIGVVDQAAMQLTPLAWAGEEQDFLAAVSGRLSLRESDSQQRALVAQAAVAKEALISNDVANDSRIRFKQEHAQRGIRSLAAFPLVVDDRVLGVFALHAAEVGFFDDDELRLLGELAGDISFALEHIDKEEKLERLNRVYAVLSGINGLIVRVRDREELYREACKIAVHAGGFKLAWIGAVEREGMRVTPVAFEGAAQGYIDRMPMDLDEGTEQGRGLAGRAVRERKPMIANDIENDARVLLRKEAVMRGFRSLVVLPLVVSDNVAGLLALYAESPGFFDDQEMRLLLELAGDISFALEHLEQEDKLDYLAYYDSITGLANRTLFRERLEQHLHEAGRAQRQLAVIVVDIERFRTINDTFGRQAGDALLKQMAARFLEVAGDPGALARLGADHFAVMVPHVRLEEDLVRMIEAARSRILAKPFSLDGTELRIATKAGIAVFPSNGADAETLLRNAEAALQKAKASGERHVFYAPQMNERVAEKLSLENKLRQALEKNEFVLHYQPKIDLETRAIVGVEALIRWQSPDLGLVPPGKFIPLLEETGLILEAGSWALTRAALDHRRWFEAGLKPPRVAVNVSAIQLRQRDFVSIVERAVMEGMAPVAIDLEITESLIMEDVEATIEKLKNVRALGIKMAIDDFGTGYSSLAYLSKLPVETVKIDRSFVITMLADPDTATLVQTMITLAHSLRLTVVAEGVDAEEQAKVLRLLRCDQMQGYLFSKPLPPDQITALLKAKD